MSVVVLSFALYVPDRPVSLLPFGFLGRERETETGQVLEMA